ncbi:flavin-containing monooxygenase [Ornithinimicrobium cryptoxanthini]|uniref:NAD(P)-binding domain-containing protein n=1 Tax=Ornithinimicrobium cryptoxanthini TaxID=2934161 RepID=A0ABY4YJC7_9MICO|nr:NAD(P)-binding domain-containing protein [Ornithinimicrobium cryptoxanthini]USQ76888.1 NAD(P)-binding domain-containing protein [Ornithinimicrobium cryptoxanthini]
MTDTSTYAVIGAGPSGLAAARNLQRFGLPWTGYELADGVGGLWDIEAPRSTVYASAHLISSRTTTEFTEHPMPAGTPDYPSHRHLLDYFASFADRFDLRAGYRFGTEVAEVVPDGDRWVVRSTGPGGIPQEQTHAGVIIANGTLSEPNVPDLPGHFDGELFHTAAYKHGEVFAGKRVLVVGGGNSGCDIAVDAVHHAASVDISMRRGYHFVPKYVFGRPADTLNGGRPLPARIKQAVDTRLLRMFTGDPTRFGFPEPDHKLYESHPVVNSLILHHAGHGDVTVRPDLERLDGDGVVFRDGSRQAYDVVVLATGYRLHYPFVERSLLSWPEGSGAPSLYLQVASPAVDNLFVVGMVEAAGIGWQGRYEQAELVAAYLAAQRSAPERAATMRARASDRSSWPDLTGGYDYLGVERMAYYVNKDAYRRAVRAQTAELGVTP